VSNITPDPKTGVGGWEKDEITELLKTGVHALSPQGCRSPQQCTQIANRCL